MLRDLWVAASRYFIKFSAIVARANSKFVARVWKHMDCNVRRYKKDVRKQIAYGLSYLDNADPFKVAIYYIVLIGYP